MPSQKDSEHPHPLTQTPKEKDPPKIMPQERVAGGPKAVESALRVSVREMGWIRGTRALLGVNQKDGFDCPGCAWPEPEDRRAVAEFCENGAKAIADEATKKRITPQFFQEHSIQELSEQSDYWLGQQGRLTEPMWLAPGVTHYEPIGWDEAFRLVARILNSLPFPDQAIFYTSGRTSNEAAFLYQLFVRLYGTNNLPDCSNMCHESSGVALTEVIGSGKGTVLLSDFDHADCIVVIGQNPGTNHPRMLSALETAARRGCNIISINPLAETGLMTFRHPQKLRGWLGRGTPLARYHLPIRVNGDVAALKGIMKVLLDENSRGGATLKDQFIEQRTEGFESFAQDIRSTPWEEIEGGSGISRDRIREVAVAIGCSKRLICCWAMGITQHKNAVANIQEVVNLLLLGGHFGRPGAGACPVRGHSNVQGDRTMGIWESPSPQFLAALGHEFDFSPPENPGYNTVHAIQALHEGKASVLFAMGGNFLSASPDTEYTAEALRRSELTVQCSTKLNRSHLVTGKQALILPCLGRTEIDIEQEGPQFVTVEDSMGMVHASRGVLPPASELLRSEVAIVCGLARSTLAERTFIDWNRLCGNYDLIREHISRVVPGFENFNQRIRRPGGFCLPHPVRDKLEFRTPSGKARFTVHPIPHRKILAGQYLMMTIRSHDQYNTTIYGLEDRYRGISGGRRVLLMNAADIEAAKLHTGDRVDITSHHNGRTRRLTDFSLVEYNIPPGSVATYFPEANALVPVDSFADKSYTPTSKSIVVEVRPSFW